MCHIFLQNGTCSADIHANMVSICLMANAHTKWTYQKEPPTDHQVTVLQMNSGPDLGGRLLNQKNCENAMIPGFSCWCISTCQRRNGKAYLTRMSISTNSFGINNMHLLTFFCLFPFSSRSFSLSKLINFLSLAA